jgi:cytochrome b6-f complex iron-sulfur subunit
MDEAPMPRRGFLATLSAVLGSIPVLGAFWTGVRVALAPAGSDRPARIPLCRVDDIQDDRILQRPISYRMRRGGAVESVAGLVFVTRDPQSKEILALSGECTHLGCMVHLSEEPGPPLRCPCHGGKFSRTGQVLDGPPPRPLRRLRIELPADGKGMIHLLEA